MKEIEEKDEVPYRPGRTPEILGSVVARGPI